MLVYHLVCKESQGFMLRYDNFQSTRIARTVARERENKASLRKKSTCK